MGFDIPVRDIQLQIWSTSLHFFGSLIHRGFRSSNNQYEKLQSSDRIQGGENSGKLSIFNRSDPHHHSSICLEQHKTATLPSVSQEYSTVGLRLSPSVKQK